MKLIFATHNQHKADEIRSSFLSRYQVLYLKDLDFNTEIEETGSSLEENAIIKASFIFKEFGIPCFADDSGLEIEALGGKPGVFSARFAGEKATFKDNCNLVLAKLKDSKERTAVFRTVFCLI